MQYEIAATLPEQLKVSDIDLKCFGTVGKGNGIQSYSGCDVAQYNWKHLPIGYR